MPSRISKLCMAWMTAAVLSFFSLQAAAASFVVNTSSDDADIDVGDGVCATALGSCSLRAALEEALFIQQQSQSAPTVEIDFAIPGEGIQTIALGSGLPSMANVYIRGRSQGGEGYAGPPLIELDGRNAGQFSSGVVASNAAVIEGLAIFGFGFHGAVLNDATLYGSYIGVRADGITTQMNRDSAVVLGVNAVLGLPAPEGVDGLDCGTHCVVVSGNRRDGVEILGSNVRIDNARIGVGPDGVSPMPNGRAGIRVSLLQAGAAQNVHIGVNDVVVSAFNMAAGLDISDQPVQAPERVRYDHVLFYANHQGAVRFGVAGFPLNDLNDLDSGANQRINTPYLQNISLLSSGEGWLLEGVSRARYLHVYVADDLGEDARTDHGTRALLAIIDLDSDANSATGNASYNDPLYGEDNARAFEVVVPARAIGQRLIAAARDAQGNTSVLSNPLRYVGAMIDSDGDGLPDALEIAYGLNPNNADTDGDSLSDGEEWGPGPYPRDTDGDGVIDALDPDDDGDGIPTLEEILAVGTVIDLDQDGLPAWRDLDSDGDGIPDAAEYAAGLPNHDMDGDGQPNWNDVDSDADGLCDSPLVNSSTCVGGEDLNADGVVDPGETNPYQEDTDGDGVCDGPNQVGTCVAAADNCPLVPNADQLDSVGDGVGDACRCDEDDCAPNVTRCFADVDGDGFTGTPIVLSGVVDCASQHFAGVPLTAVSDGDCDDQNARIHPGAIEICDGVDNNCNGLIDSQDPSIRDRDPALTGALSTQVFDDLDGDGCGMQGTAHFVCSLDDPNIALNDNDQDDTDGVCCGNGVREEGEACDGDDVGTTQCPAGMFGVPLCNNSDENTVGDGTCSFASPPVGCWQMKACYADLDGDGFTGTLRHIHVDDSCGSYTSGPANTPWTEVSDGDCRDLPSSPCALSTYPGAPELCDGCINDCDRRDLQDGADEEWFADACEIDENDPEDYICATIGLVCDPNTREPVCGAVEQRSYDVYFRDADNDSCGDPNVSMQLCDGDELPDEGWVENAYDLDDTDGVCCGNEIRELGEECDSETVACSELGYETDGLATCTDSCLWNRDRCELTLCGDGVVDADHGETCDPEAPDAPENCRDTCTFCGDDVIQPLAGETCELSDEPRCRAETCTFCGDGVVQAGEGEECEPTEGNSPQCAYGETHCTFCSDSCTVEEGTTSFCGDGIVQADEGEECDGEEGCDEFCQWNEDQDGVTPQPTDDSGCGCQVRGTTGLTNLGLLSCFVFALLLVLRRSKGPNVE